MNRNAQKDMRSQAIQGHTVYSFDFDSNRSTLIFYYILNLFQLVAFFFIHSDWISNLLLIIRRIAGIQFILLLQQKV